MVTPCLYELFVSPNTTLHMAPCLPGRVTGNTQHLGLYIIIRPLAAKFHTLLTTKFSHWFPHLFKFCQASACSAFGGIFKCNIWEATISRTVLATPRSVEKIHPIMLKLWLFLHIVNTKAWFLMDVFLPLSWEKLSQALTGAPFLTFLPFSLFCCCHYGVCT